VNLLLGNLVLEVSDVDDTGGGNGRALLAGLLSETAVSVGGGIVRTLSSEVGGVEALGNESLEGSQLREVLGTGVAGDGSGGAGGRATGGQGKTTESEPAISISIERAD
jgi:hypothetical protein